MRVALLNVIRWPISTRRRLWRMCEASVRETYICHVSSAVQVETMLLTGWGIEETMSQVGGRAVREVMTEAELLVTRRAWRAAAVESLSDLASAWPRQTTAALLCDLLRSTIVTTLSMRANGDAYGDTARHDELYVYHVFVADDDARGTLDVADEDIRMSLRRLACAN